MILALAEIEAAGKRRIAMGVVGNGRNGEMLNEISGFSAGVGGA